MKKLLLTLVAIPAATFAIEASAQTNASVNMQNRIANLEMRINAGIQAGVINRTEERSLRNQLQTLRQLESRYARNGLTRQERNTLQTRIRSLRDSLRVAGGTGWANRYGWNDTDLDVYSSYGTTYGTTGYTYDQYGRRVPAPTVTYDRYGRPITSGYYGQGGPYEPVPSTGVSSGIGGILSSILGGNGLRIGDVISGVTGGALSRPTGYQDRSNVYFRTDGQRVYEIDARTNRVIRIHPAR